MAARLQLKTKRPKTGVYSRAALEKKYKSRNKLRDERKAEADRTNQLIHWPLPKGYKPPKKEYLYR